MIKNVVSGIGGVGAFGAISIVIFFIVFTGMLLWAFLQKKSHLKAASTLPLQDGSIDEKKGSVTHE